MHYRQLFLAAFVGVLFVVRGNASTGQGIEDVEGSANSEVVTVHRIARHHKNPQDHAHDHISPATNSPINLRVKRNGNIDDITEGDEVAIDGAAAVRSNVPTQKPQIGSGSQVGGSGIGHGARGSQSQGIGSGAHGSQSQGIGSGVGTSSSSSIGSGTRLGQNPSLGTGASLSVTQAPGIGSGAETQVLQRSKELGELRRFKRGISSSPATVDFSDVPVDTLTRTKEVSELRRFRRGVLETIPEVNESDVRVKRSPPPLVGGSTDPVANQQTHKVVMDHAHVELAKSRPRRLSEYKSFDNDYTKECNSYYGRIICYRLYSNRNIIPSPDYTCWRALDGRRNCTELESVRFLRSEGIDFEIRAKKSDTPTVGYNDGYGQTDESSFDFGKLFGRRDEGEETEMAETKVDNIGEVTDVAGYYDPYNIQSGHQATDPDAALVRVKRPPPEPLSDY